MNLSVVVIPQLLPEDAQNVRVFQHIGPPTNSTLEKEDALLW